MRNDQPNETDLSMGAPLDARVEHRNYL